MEIEKNIIQQYFNEKISEIEFIGSGWHNILYLINKNFVARLSFTEHGKSKMILYSKIQESITLPVFTPKYISLNLIDDKKYKALAIYKYFEGKRANFYNLNKPNISILSKTISEIHKLDFFDKFKKPNLKELLQFEIHNLKKYVFNHLLKSERTFINNLYDKYLQSSVLKKVTPLFVHGDISYNNMIMSKDKLIALIDWDGMHYNDPMFDFQRFSINEFEELLIDYPNKELLGDDLLFRYLFYRIRTDTYAMYYSMENELNKNRWNDLYNNFKFIKKENEQLYNLL